MFFKLVKMNNYLKQVKQVSKNVSDILAVMGNESVDLDSAGNLCHFQNFLKYHKIQFFHSFINFSCLSSK